MVKLRHLHILWEAAPFALPSGAGPGDDGTGQLPLVVEVPDRAFEEAGFRPFDEIVLFPGVQHVHLHGERPAEQVEQGAEDLLNGKSALHMSGFPIPWSVPTCAESCSRRLSPRQRPTIGSDGGARRVSQTGPSSPMATFSSCTIILPGAKVMPGSRVSTMPGRSSV